MGAEKRKHFILFNLQGKTDRKIGVVESVWEVRSSSYIRHNSESVLNVSAVISRELAFLPVLVFLPMMT